MYLFVFAVLLIIFQYANAKRIFEDQNRKLEKSKAKVERLTDSVVVLQDKAEKLTYFNLESNEDALSYFENEGYNVSNLIPTIKDAIYTTNEANGEHPIVPYASADNRKMLINNVKLLNHKWVIADFSDGEYWGEVFFTYEVKNDKTVTFNLVESFLYPFD
ncbi:hypothetical protein MHTCC0001_04290 [Flavobacteriaceae bacterium MHTCC 0001]